jgi:hypothetical protein
MKEMLHGLDDDRLLPADDVGDPLDAQKIVAVIDDEGIKLIRQAIPMKRLVELQTKRADLRIMAIDIVVMMAVVAVVVSVVRMPRRVRGDIRGSIGLRIQPFQDLLALRPGVVDVYGRNCGRQHDFIER